MKIVVADTGALISLGHVGQIHQIEQVLGEVYIAQAVWEELLNYQHPDFNSQILHFLNLKVRQISATNQLLTFMDYGEAESVLLYEEIKADYLLIDDRQARLFAESLGVNCIGSIGLLIRAKQQNLIPALKPIFEHWLALHRYFSKPLLNKILDELGEDNI